MTNSTGSQEGWWQTALHLAERIGHIDARLTAVERTTATMGSMMPSPHSTPQQPTSADSAQHSGGILNDPRVQRAEKVVSTVHTFWQGLIQLWQFMLWAMPRFGLPAGGLEILRHILHSAGLL